MDISICSAQLLSEYHLVSQLPKEVLDALRQGSNAVYMDAISQLTLNPEYTTTIFTTHEPVFVEICSRWLVAPGADYFSALAALARVLPSAPHLWIYAQTLLEKRGNKTIEALASRRVTALQDLANEELHSLLLVIFRLLYFDNATFAAAVSPVQLQLLLQHAQLHIRYLAIRILCLYLHASDVALVSMVETYIGEDDIAGNWEGKIIDYTFFSMWEHRRLSNIDEKLHQARNALACQRNNNSQIQRILELENLSRMTACVGGVLLPRIGGSCSGNSHLVMTQRMTNNLRLLSEGVKGPKPLLVTGFSGAGKSSLIRELAKELGKSASMITLHLNEQTDAKLLIGMYTSGKTPGSFHWRPGVLTTAVMEGRWVVIEDLDRAPTEIISILLPLLERREIFIPHWGETLGAAPGFRLIATVRSIVNSRGEAFNPITNMMGVRHWLQIPLQMPSDDELAEVVLHRFPVLRAYIPKFMDVYRTSRNLNPLIAPSSIMKTNFRRPLGPQNLLGWCSRVQDLMLTAGIETGYEPISDLIVDHTFLEAIDCFLGALPVDALKVQGVELVAQSLHVPAKRAHYCLNVRKPDYHSNESILRIGRASLSKQKRTRGTKSREATGPFAMTNHVLRILESVAVTIRQAEPCLLVGETGTGKTTVVQQLADALNQKLTVVNLSQQSEAGDLLGGYKPVNLQSLAVPIKEEFDELLDITFSSKRNQHYIDTLGKSISKRRWARALALWQGALRMVETQLKPATNNETDVQEPRSKKRKLQSPNVQKLRNRWDKFASKVQAFQTHLTSGSKGFAFSFIEGNIVKAARNGEWVLLDEINLASPDTLESLADLFSSTFDGGPSILLTETGNTERIYAHKDFRIFGAMNPATDVGKHDLPMSLRSRFTELYIEAPDKDLENLVFVIKAYLGNHNHVDVRAAVDIAHLYLEIKQLANENRLVDGANQKPHFSLRTLTRTLVYTLDIAPIYGLRRALFEGFSMSFLTVLSRESELLLQPRVEKHILSAENNSRAILNQTPRLPQDGKNYVQFRHYWIAQGTGTIEEQPHYIITPFIERNLLNLVRATSTRRFPVLLEGPTSSGKTSMIECLAKISGNIFVRINNHEHTDLQEYLGTYVSGPDGRLRYHDGILVHALREGYWVVLDELNLAPTEVLEALNRLLDDNRELFIAETQEVVRPHPNFMLFATQNPSGVYGGRKVLSRAFRNRFLELHFDNIPEDELEIVLRERTKIAPQFCTKIVAVYKQLSILRRSERLFEQKNSFATLRDLFRWAMRNAELREDLAVDGFLLLAERVRNQKEHLAVKRAIENVMKVKIDQDQIYATDRIARSLGLPMAASSRLVWTRSMRRLGVLVLEAMKNGEPVLLVGDTGTGKTTICQVISEMMKTKLHIVNAHQNMETGDLIGAQRPMRKRAHARSQLIQELVAVLKDYDVYDNEFGDDYFKLLAAYETLQRHPAKEISEVVRARIEQSRCQANALFEWVDGSLVHAMQNGDHFLLDEISLADDSVLERLNSVLEPSRTLFLAEKGITDALVVASPGFQFLATMNPGGDYGKRELSPALRNRFTEIWVPNASDEDELLEIAKAKLKPSLIEFAESMVLFVAWHAETYNNTAPHGSIRDLLAWIHFVNCLNVTDPRLALLHGAAMVYIDGLGANPASKVSIPEAEVPQQRLMCLTKLHKLFDCAPSAVYTIPLQPLITSETFAIGPFSLAKKLSMAPNMRYSLQAPTTILNAMKVLRALQVRKPILLEGSPGVGKTTLVAALAQAIGMPLTRINLSDQTDLMDLFGSDVPIEGAEAGHFGWHNAPFLQAMQKGEWVLLDEMNLASQSVLEGLNACLDHRGQVYVSELDQTFDRHPDFVVFAAQNPHHQGGGRKGLPASFVNRFTVVYADIFTAEDLLIISKEMFPDVPCDTTDTILQCVLALGQLLQQDRGLGANGGPWEMNLRDALRWLHLLTCKDGLMLSAKPEDFLQVLFLQRFRTPQDVTAVAHKLKQYLPQSTSRTYFHGRSPGSVEIGLGFLPRGSYSPAAWSEHHNARHINLPLAESVMICVQNNWPCLLVGASGSGKKSLINKLGGSVGADVVNLSLNSEMDSMDLIGGYEQLDPERRVAGFVRRVHEYTRRAIIQQLGSGSGVDANLAELVTKVQAKATNKAEISKLIRVVAEEHTFSEFPSFWRECQGLMQQSAVDNKARFEWVDGVLLKTLKQGKWLILDNANVCDPSILDRLNSLLEPNGFLSINEHRNPDGTAQIIRPHRDFRLFMTMDPRHGELSRAMRNRSVELFMPTESPKVEVLDSRIAYNVSRFELFQAFDWGSLNNIRFENMLSFCFDHLTFHDLKLCQRWCSQFMGGLKEFSSEQKFRILSIATSYQRMSQQDGEIVNGIKSTYEEIDRDLGLLSSFERMQTIHPFNNPILLYMTAQNRPASNLRWLGHCFELLLEFSRYGQTLTLTAEKAESMPPRQMSHLERSLVFANDGRFKGDSTQPLAPFLQAMVIYLQHTVDGRGFREAEDGEEMLSFAREILLYLQDMSDLAQSPNFEDGVFQVYQGIGRSMCARAITEGLSRGGIVKLAAMLALKLDTFNSSWQLYSGLGMEKLWMTFRPSVAKTLSQLNFSLEARALAHRFDALKWSTDASVPKLDVLRDLIARVHDAVGTASTESFGQLEVVINFLTTWRMLTQAQDIKRGIGELENCSTPLQAVTHPYFQSQFEMLCQYAAYANQEESTELPSILGLLAGRSTAISKAFGASSRACNMLSQLQRMTAVGQQPTELATIRNELLISVLHKLEHISEVSLQSLPMLRTEIEVLAKTIASSSQILSGNPLLSLARVLGRLHEEVNKALGIRVKSDEFESIKKFLKQLLRRLSGKRYNQNTSHGRDNHLFESLARPVETRYGLSQRELSTGSDELAEAALACVQLFTGCLIFYVPDRPFDPALRSKVELKRYRKRKAELESKLQVLKEFELVFSGQMTSFRIELTEQSLRALGAAPEVPSIVRPKVSELERLQAEFNSILNTVILKSPAPNVLHLVSQGQTLQVHEIKLLRSNIAQTIARLSQSFEAYEDITKPLIAMLQGLDLGLALAVLSGIEPKAEDQIMEVLCKTTPFLGACPSFLSRSPFINIKASRAANFDPRFHLLEIIALARSVSKDLGNPSTREMFQAFHNLYQEWKDQLGRNQQQNAVKSSLYRYRGSEKDNDGTDELGFFQLFPNYENPNEEAVLPGSAVYDHRYHAQRAAALQRHIYQNPQDVPQRLLSVLRGASQTISRTWQDHDVLAKYTAPAENMLSAVILSIDDCRERLDGQANLGKLYNFYTDANVVEGQRLVGLVRKVQSRFIDLQNAWPEHATLGEVLRTSSEVMALRNTEPLAKLLTKAEQLHNFVHEWQVVASREYTATSLYEELTNLLVSWRRLELSSWARLLDMEDNKCKDDADSWWFIAYEVIVAAPCSLVDAQALRSHAEGMFSTLAQFLATTSVGQYSHRLAMIDCFKSHLEVLVRDTPAMTVICNALANFLSYYTRFQPGIEETLRKGRQALEKDIKEILLLASWKDTNINALRDSAKRSHHKLFKVVRKYRALLAQSSETVIQQTFPVQALISDISSLDAQHTWRAIMDPRALQICQQRITGWQTKAARFTKPISTTNIMLQMTQFPAKAIDASPYLDSFGAELMESIEVLQKETPTKATKENGESIKRLKARKRKLYAETLKYLRQMGFSSNVSADILAKQESLAVMLTSSPAFTDRFSMSGGKNAEYYFHKLLSMMPQVKERARSHPEDLTYREVRRSVGYLESMISIILRQRALIATAGTQLRCLSEMTDQMQCLWAPDSYTLRKKQQAIDDAKDIHHILRWLPEILEAGSIIVEKHAKMGGADGSVIIERLKHWKGQIAAIRREFDDLPTLPAGLSSSRHVDAHVQAENSLRDLKTHLQEMIEEYPGLGFVIKQIALWTDAEVVSHQVTQNGVNAIGLGEFDNNISTVLDSVLVAVQRMQEAYTSIPTTEEETAWFLRTDESLASSLKRLGCQEVNRMLQTTMSKMRYLSAGDGVLDVGAAVCAMALPIFEGYSLVQQIVLARYIKLHQSLCKLASLLADYFLQIVSDGFGSPAEESAAEDGKSGRLETGTGLGEGEGADDISKDVEDDEDLSELAQQGRQKKDGDAIEDQEDAVNMDQDELEGELGDFSGKGEDDGSASEAEDDMMDEETGSVDDLDSAAVDQKLWNGKAEQTEKEREGSKSKGKANKDEKDVAEPAAQEHDGRHGEKSDEDEANPEDAEEGEEVAKVETEKMDSHAQDAENLDLPEEMDLDNMDPSEADCASEDGDMDQLSDIEETQHAEDIEDKKLGAPQDDELGEMAHSPQIEQGDAEETEAPVDMEPSDDEQEDEGRLLWDTSNKAAVDQANLAPSDSRWSGEQMEQQQEEEQIAQIQAQTKKGTKGTSSIQKDAEAVAEDGPLGQVMDKSERGEGTEDKPSNHSSSQAFQKLGDALEKWHRRQRQIQDAAEKRSDAQWQSPEGDMADQEFEHLQDEEAEADTQALGAATNEQAHALDENAMDSEMRDEPGQLPPDGVDEKDTDDHNENMDGIEAIIKEAVNQQEQSRAGTFIANNHDRNRSMDKGNSLDAQDKGDIDELENDFSTTYLQPRSELLPRSIDEARQLWAHYDSLTRNLSLFLTEQLRLILAPTLATKMRGDFRTGKRLNIKRIVPYIASQYKRDKIWMRRSIPCKRNYQIMLAVDDSKSMGESGSGQLAFETLALVVKSLSMLEVGEICIVGFGNEVHVAHDFDIPFSPEAGAQIFQHLTFQQTKTDIRKLVADSIALFREARRKSFNAGTDLWQLELIISDGVCEDHDTVRRFVRQAQEERIMIVFVIVDALLNGESIVGMSQAVFEPDDVGGQKLKIKRYLDSFPFPYYLVVGNVMDLPGVLAQALRQWFAEVVESI